MSDSATPWTVARQASLFMRFPRQEYWSGLPFLSPGDLSDAGIKPPSPALAGGFFTTEPPGKLKFSMQQVYWRMLLERGREKYRRRLREVLGCNVVMKGRLSPCGALK